MEFTQAGVELLGSTAPEADAEVIAQAAEALKNVGIENFQIDIGQVGFFKGIMQETGLSEDEIEQIRTLIDTKDFVGIELLVKSHTIDDYLKKLIFEMPRLFGPPAILDKLDKSKLNKVSLEAIDNLKKIIAVLHDYGFEKYVSVDLGLVQSLNYYTGTIFKGFTYGVGSPVLSGGRYDGLLEQFGRKCPATGFSLSVNDLVSALDGQKIELPKPEIDSLVAYSRGSRAAAFTICRILRKEGLAIDIFPGPVEREASLDYADKRGIGGVVYLGEINRITIYDRAKGTSTETTLEKISRSVGADPAGKEPVK
jgi:ATP phosphoribosyltransferase regulatory subunit